MLDPIARTATVWLLATESEADDKDTAP
jgi:hypothetical protein